MHHPQSNDDRRGEGMPSHPLNTSPQRHQSGYGAANQQASDSEIDRQRASSEFVSVTEDASIYNAGYEAVYEDQESTSVETIEQRYSASRPSPADLSGYSLSALIFSKLVWLTGTSLVFLGAWVLGPRLVEHYQYASTKGRIQAEYDVATVALKDSPLENLSSAYRMVARRISPSVVHISTVSTARWTLPSELGTEGETELFPSEGQGSGVIVSNDGYILTNEHVIHNAERIDVVLNDRRTYKADLIGVDEATDLAVLKIDAPDLIPAEWGDSDELEVGSMVWAVGSPFGLAQSITFGIISAKHRKTNHNSLQDLIQSDAAVNPGNSGGPLVNEKGQVVGINTSIVGKTYQGISFSVPSALARPIFDRIVKYGSVERGFLGVTPTLVNQVDAKEQGLPNLKGAYVMSVMQDSPAYEGGLRAGDVITRWNGKPIENDIMLFCQVGLTAINSTAEVGFIRNGEELTSHVTVAKRPEVEENPTSEFDE